MHRPLWLACLHVQPFFIFLIHPVHLLFVDNLQLQVNGAAILSLVWLAVEPLSGTTCLRPPNTAGFNFEYG